MPAAAVIPALIVYIKVVAVKKLVVEFLSVVGVGFGHASRGHPSANCIHPSLVDAGSRQFTLKKLECFRQAFAGIH